MAIYRKSVEEKWAGLGMWEYLSYDDAGDLWLGELRVLDACQKYGTPLEIVDTTLIERRSSEFFALVEGLREAIQYPGSCDFLYASKANMASEMTHAAYRSGWNAETSAVQDLEHLMWMHDKGLLPRDPASLSSPNSPIDSSDKSNRSDRKGFRVVCNGFKMPAEVLGWPAPRPVATKSRIDLPRKDVSKIRPWAPYADTIREMATSGWDITPILDEGEIAQFMRPGDPEMNVGLRLKFGKVRDRAALAGHQSRFGFSVHELQANARKIAASDNLNLTTLHTMVGAAETIPVERFVDSLLLAGDIYFELKAEFPSLRELNMGGGMPPLGENYDHAAVIEGWMRGLMERAEKAGLPAPNLTFEFGSLVVAEAGFHVFRVLQRKQNLGRPIAETQDVESTPIDSEPTPAWAIVDGGLMAAIPDMLLIGKSFRILAVQGANREAVPVVLGDLSCDSDGRYPPADAEDESILLPAVDPLADGGTECHVLIQGVGAYQEILSGVRGAHHCGLLEAIELIIERDASGRVRGRLFPRQTPEEAAHMLGYDAESAEALLETIRSEPTESG